MKHFDFNYKDRQWDKFGAFHAFHRAWNSNIVEFETGELMVIGEPNPDNRHMYDKYNIQLVTTTDKDCPQLYFDKECTEPVKKAWVTHKGQQHLAIDYERKVAVALHNRWSNKKSTVLGHHVSRASAYWAGEERLPTPLEKIKVQTPDPEYKKNMKSVLDEVDAAVTAIWRMDTGEKRYWWDKEKLLANPQWHDSSAEDIVAEVCKNRDNLRAVAERGFEYPRKTQKVDFLYVKPQEKH